MKRNPLDQWYGYTIKAPPQKKQNKTNKKKNKKKQREKYQDLTRELMKLDNI